MSRRLVGEGVESLGLVGLGSAVRGRLVDGYDSRETGWEVLHAGRQKIVGLLQVLAAQEEGVQQQEGVQNSERGIVASSADFLPDWWRARGVEG